MSVALSCRGFGLAGLLLLAAAPALAENWLETRAAIEDLVDSRDFAAASSLGDELLAAARGQFGELSPQLVFSHRLLAEIYRSDQDYIEAESQLLQAIRILEGNDGPLSESLIDPLIELGETYRESSDYEPALAVYDRARAIGRRRSGLLNQDQVPILVRMSDTALQMRDFDRAQALRLEAVHVVQRFEGSSGPEVVDTYLAYARWLTALRRFDEAERAHRDVQDVIRDQFDDDPWLHVQLLRAQAARFRDMGRVPPGAYGTNTPLQLRRALKLVDELDPPDPVLRAEVLLDLGDWYIAMRGSAEDAEENYLAAWSLLGDLEAGQALRREWFTGLNYVRRDPLLSRVLTADANAPWGRVEVSFIVDSHGRATNIQITSSDPPGLLDGTVMRHVTNSRFRPQVDDGALIDSPASLGVDYQYDSEAATRSGITPRSGD